MEKIIINTARVEKGYCASCNLIPGWLVSFTGDFDKFRKEVQESINFYIECAKEDKEKYPSIFDNQYELVFRFDVQSLLDFYKGIFSLSALQTITGINQRQLSHYANGISKPRRPQAEKIAAGLRKLAAELQVVTV